MLFDLRPKERRNELFDREEELEELHRLSRTEWIVILGRRMTGKTSLLKTFLNEVGGVYVNLSGVRSIKGFVEELAKRVKRINVRVSIGPLTVSWTRLAEDVFAALDGKVVGLDEAQDLPANYALKLFKKIWDTYNVRIVFTGSMVGLLHHLLEPGPESPLYGRQPARLQLQPFNRSLSIEFLREGFRECGLRPSERELDEAVELLGGYPGWLTYYGNARCVRGLDHRRALELVYEEGRKVLMEELKRFLSTRRNPQAYVKLLKALPARWSELRRILDVNSKTLRDMLRSLQNAMIVEKVGQTYTIPDPVMRRLVYELKNTL